MTDTLQPVAPCPFCGGAGTRLVRERDLNHGYRSRVQCSTCHAKGPASVTSAITKWNTRATTNGDTLSGDLLPPGTMLIFFRCLDAGCKVQRKLTIKETGTPRPLAQLVHEEFTRLTHEEPGHNWISYKIATPTKRPQ